MLTPDEKRILKKRLEKFEGRVPYMYLDTKGRVTVGVGHEIRTVTVAQKLPFRTTKGAKATADEIKAAYMMVKAQSKGRKAEYYRRFTELSISETEIDRLTNQHIASFYRELKRLYTGFDGFPSSARLALFDLIFNVGMTNLRTGWPSLNLAIKKKDWEAASDESGRAPPISPDRNKYVANLFDKAAKEEKK